MSDLASIANLTPEESFKAGLPVVLQLEAWVAQGESLQAHSAQHQRHFADAYATGYVDALRKALALVTAKDADRDLGQ